MSSVLTSTAMAQNEGVTKALTTSLERSIFQATLKSGYHFNDKAPIMLKVDDRKILPTELKKQSVSFKLPAEYQTAEAALYICDDSNTFCEPRHIDLKASKGEAEKADTNKEQDKKKEAKKSTLKKNPHGFYEASLDDVKDLATKEKKLLLVDFSARWCPGCIRLEQEVFDSSEFKKASKNFLKVKLDVDRFENMDTKKSYNVWAIPTLLVLNSDLKEISRIVDYQPTTTVSDFLNLAAKTPFTFEELKAKADAGDSESALMLGQREYNAAAYEEAVKYLSRVSPTPIELADAKVQAAQKKFESDEKSEKLKTQLQKTIREALVEEPSSSRSMVWRDLLAATMPSGAERKKIAQEGLAVGDKILADEKNLLNAMKGDLVGEFAGLEKLLVAFHRADLAKTGELDEAELTKANQLVAEIGKELKIPISKKGPSLRYLIALVGAKDFAAAEIQARKLLARDPKNPELQRRLLKILNENKKFAEAIKVGKQALTGSYDRNEVWVVQQLAKAYGGNSQDIEKRALITSYLQRSDIDWSKLKDEKQDLESQLK